MRCTPHELQTRGTSQPGRKCDVRSAAALLSSLVVAACSSPPAIVASSSGGSAGASGGAGSGSALGGGSQSGQSGSAGAGLAGGPTSGSAGAAGERPAGNGGAAGDPGPRTCTGRSLPDSIPQDWKEWTGWSCGCSLYYPPALAANTPPLEWAPCKDLTPTGVDCSELVIPSLSASDKVTNASFQRDSITGHPTLQLGILHPASSDKTHRLLVYDLSDSRLISAMTQASVTDCGQGHNGVPYFELRGYAGGRQVAILNDTYKPSPPFGSVPTTGGWISFDASSGGPPVIGNREEDPDSDPPLDVRAAPLGVFESRMTRWFVPWLGPSQQVPDTDVLLNIVMVPNGDAWFPSVPPSAWSFVSGAVPNPLGTPDSIQLDSDVATDGVDLVWNRTTGEVPSATKRDLMVASYSLDPDLVKLSTRRVKEAGNQAGIAVGCGHVARRVLGTDLHATLEVNRLVDGATWQLPPLPDGEWSWMPWGVDCNEVFAQVYQVGTYRYVRIRLDSIGAPSFPN